MAPTHSKTGRPLRRLIVAASTALAAAAFIFAGAGTANAADTPSWTPPTITLAGKCFDAARGTGDIQYSIAESAQNVNGTSYKATLDGNVFAVFQVASGETFADWVSSSHVTVSQGTHTLTFTNIDTEGIAPITKTIDIAACAAPPTLKTASASVVIKSAATCESSSVVEASVVGAHLVGTLETKPGSYWASFAADEGYTFDHGTTLSVKYTVDPALTGSQCATDPSTTVSTTTTAKTSPLTGTSAPQTGARGDSISPVNAALGLGIGGTTVLALLTIAVIAYRRSRTTS